MRRILLVLPGLIAALIITGEIQAQNAVISIDNVTNEYTPTQLRAGYLHRVSLRYNCLSLSSESLWIGANAFRVYSPDGADWGYLKGSAGPLVEAAGPPITYLKHFNFDGSTWTMTGNQGANPAGGSTGSISQAGFYLATVSFGTDGYVGGLHNDIAAVLDFTSRPEDDGLTLCLAPDLNGDMVTWQWAAGGGMDVPLWDNGLGVDGPRCWEVYPVDCCEGRRGDANGVGGDEPTIGDVSAMIDAKFITGTCDGIILCLEEADINKSGGAFSACDDITLGDIAILIDYLFITGSSLGLPDCW